MQFATSVPIAEGSPKIDHESNIVSLGSCFAMNIGQKLDYFKFSNTINPFGILFHPLALEKAIDFAVNNKTFTEADIFFYNEHWHCYDAHSDLSDTNAGVLIKKLNKAGRLLAEKLRNASHIIITLGTAWVYRQNTTRNLVANCHKVPQAAFTKEILTVDAIMQSLQNIAELVYQLNKNVQIIFTISPVRHIKDGFTENQWSKANLISALHQLLKTENSKTKTWYFPAYEIMMDELRDYRFYAEDMLHPSQTAIHYIWECFTNAWINNEAQHTMKEIDSIQKGLQHRPFNAESESHKKFLLNLQTKTQLLQQKYPYIKF
ncbi:GSCFA domain-containing protein [Flavobacterium rhizosphaerae]|uniref:GSCFA domain-containing protein n=1 Tax=Flavobacterium rhizosphaerae TaxID=3163298 RepID=A0ABW8Z0Y0_9FLAO